MLYPNVLSKGGSLGFFFHNPNTKTNLGNRLEKLPSYEMKIPLHADNNSATVGQ